MRYELPFTILLLAGLALAVGMSPAIASSATVAERPVAVSPGDASRVAVVEGRCPTFSWGEVQGAKSYELVVYRVGDEGEEAKPVLEESFAGSVESWTPSLDRCFERGARYAWSVRTVAEEAPSEWSPPSMFEVAAGPSEAEFEEALDVVRRYVSEREEATYSGPPRVAGSIPVSASPVPPPPPAPLAPAAPTVLSVDGNVDAVSFTGDGANLAGVALSDELCALWAEVSSAPSFCDKKVFTTSTQYSGNLGFLEGADAKCNERASAAGLLGTYKAWLSDSTCGVADPCRMFTQHTGRYVRTDGVVIADDWADLTDGGLLAPISVDEFGMGLVDGSGAGGFLAAFTNSSSDGTRFSTDPSRTCDDWSTATPAPASVVGGFPAFSDVLWTEAFTDPGGGLDCLTPGGTYEDDTRLYCFQQ